MAVTFKQLLNRALRIAGEDEIADATTTVSDTQQLLVAEMANQIKEEVEAAHNWRALRQTVSVAFTAATNSATISEADERSRVVRIRDNRIGAIPLVFDVTDSSNPVQLYELDLPELLRRRTMNSTQGNVQFFALDNSAGDVLKMEVYPTPAANTTISAMLIIPQARLDAADATDLATNIKIPVRPIELGLIRYILEERGEELGINSMFSEQKEAQALADAIALDVAEQGGVDLMIV